MGRERPKHQTGRVRGAAVTMWFTSCTGELLACSRPAHPYLSLGMLWGHDGGSAGWGSWCRGRHSSYLAPGKAWLALQLMHHSAQLYQHRLGLGCHPYLAAFTSQEEALLSTQVAGLIPPNILLTSPGCTDGKVSNITRTNRCLSQDECKQLYL